MLTPSPSLLPATNERGSILLEAMVAVLIFSLGVLGLIGLQAASMRSTTEAKERIDASMLVNQRIARMWADPVNLAGFAGTLNAGGSSTDADQALVSEFPNGSLTTAVNVDVATVTVTWRLPGQAADSTYQAIARIRANTTAP